MASGHLQALPEAPVPPRAKIPPARGDEMGETAVEEVDQDCAVRALWVYVPAGPRLAMPGGSANSCYSSYLDLCALLYRLGQ